MKKIAFIGIGLMGLPMAKNLLKAGYFVKVFNRSLEKAELLSQYNAEVAKSIKEVVVGADVIITMLADDEAVNVVMKNDDFLNNLKSGSTVIDMSSVKPETAKFHASKLNLKNVNYLDAPVSGGTIGAEEASLAIMVGGEQKVFEDHLDILKNIGNPSLVGPVASGQISKLANQIIVGLTIGAVAEAITLCEKSGTNNCNGSTYNGNCYKYESHSGDWFDARLACEAWGGSLVSIEESAEHDFVKSLMNPGHYRAWIGLTNFDGAEVCVE